MLTIKIDSVAEQQKQKTRTQLTLENEALRKQVADLQAQADEQADALIELAGLIG